jgi:argininosuccinate synthase
VGHEAEWFGGGCFDDFDGTEEELAEIIADLQTMVDESQASVTGTARLKLYKGGVTVTGRKSEQSLYNPEFATFEKDMVYDQADATGFIRLNALRLRIRSLMNG